MSWLMVLRGLPGSGKTSFAKALQPVWMRVSRDELRQMLWNGSYSPGRELLVKETEEGIAVAALVKQQNVIVDDTNLKQEDLLRWEEVARKVRAAGYSCTTEYKHFFDVPIEVCIERDAQREHPVGEARIREMAATPGLLYHV